MRTYSYIFLILFSFICSNQKAMGQENGTMSVLVGTWTLDYNTTFAKREMKMKALMDTIPQAQRSAIEKGYRGRTMVFGSNGDFRQVFPDGREAAGGWSMEQNGTLLVLTDPSGKRYPHRVMGLTARELVLRMEDSGEAKLFVRELYFLKN